MTKFAVENKFVSTWKTDIDDGVLLPTQIGLPLKSSGTYNMLVEWGDGTSDTITSYSDVKKTHTYPSPGTYTVKISGKCENFGWGGGTGAWKIIGIQNWGPLEINSSFFLWGCTNLISITAVDKLKLTSNNISYLTYSPITSLDCRRWDVSNQISMSHWFRSYGTLTDLRIDTWDTSNVVNFSRFLHSTRLEGIDLSFLDTSSAENLSEMFSASNIITPNIDNWNTSNVTNMQGTFQFIAGTHTVDLSNWDISNVTTMHNLFLGTMWSTENYDKALISFNNQSHQDDVPLHAGYVGYSSAAAAARASLVADGWVITDGGLI